MLTLRLALTFEEFCTLYMDQHARPHKKSWKEDERRITNYLLPAFGNKLLSEISRMDVIALHAKIGNEDEKPYQANRLLEQISKMFSLAKHWEILPTDFRNPASGVKVFRETQRMRFLSRDEAKTLLCEIAREDCLYARAAILLLLLTGLRKCEILSLKWEAINLNEGFVKIPDSKNGETIFQPLSRHAIALLSTLPRFGQNPWVIRGYKKGKPRNTLQKAWERIRERAGLQDVRIHDLRRTVGSWLTEDGHSLQVIKDVLNHKDIKTTLVYARIPSKAKRAALESHGEALTRLIS